MSTELAKRAINDFMKTWNDRDVEAFAACFREDGDFVNVLGQKANGRAAIAEMHEYPFSTVQSKATVSTQKLDMRVLDDHYVAADLWWKVVGSQTPKGEPLPDRYGLLVFVVETNGDSAVLVSGRNMDFTNSYGREAGEPQAAKGQ